MPDWLQSMWKEAGNDGKDAQDKLVREVRFP